MTALNKNNSAVKRIMQEARELSNDPSTDYSAAPLEDDIFEWHCTLRGPLGTEFEGGLYHFRIILPAEYPFRPPSIMMLTPNGRFELNTKICISFTNYHEELWQPAWGVRTAIIGLQGFFPLKGQAAVGVGSIEYPASERKRLATLSRDWTCPHCKQTNLDLLPDPSASPDQPEKGDTVVSGAVTSDSTEPKSNSTDSMAAEVPTTTTDTSNLTAIIQPPTALTLASPGGLHPGSGLSAGQPSPVMHVSSPVPRTEDALDRPLSPPALPQTARPTRNETPTSSQAQGTRRSSVKPPVLLDAAICILLVLLFAIICRRVV